MYTHRQALNLIPQQIGRERYTQTHNEVSYIEVLQVQDYKYIENDVIATVRGML